MIIEKKFVESGFENVVSISGKDITEDLIKRCFNLDKVFYGKEFLWDNTDILDVIMKYNQMCFIFMDTENQNIVGYSYWFPIKSEILDRFVKDKKAKPKPPARPSSSGGISPFSSISAPGRITLSVGFVSSGSSVSGASVSGGSVSGAFVSLSRSFSALLIRLYMIWLIFSGWA